MSHLFEWINKYMHLALFSSCSLLFISSWMSSSCSGLNPPALASVWQYGQRKSALLYTAIVRNCKRKLFVKTICEIRNRWLAWNISFFRVCFGTPVWWETRNTVTSWIPFNIEVFALDFEILVSASSIHLLTLSGDRAREMNKTITSISN